MDILYTLQRCDLISEWFARRALVVDLRAPEAWPPPVGWAQHCLEVTTNTTALAQLPQLVYVILNLTRGIFSVGSVYSWTKSQLFPIC
jgi:hypothetical protein